MSQIALRYQVSIYGSFDEIKPTADNIKFFIDKFSDKGLIPNQFTEFSLELKSQLNKGFDTTKNVEKSRLRLSDSEKKWDIRFSSDRIDFLFVNSNIGQVNMIEKDFFLSEVTEFINRINEKYQIKSNRIGLVIQYLYKELNFTKISSLFQNNISFFNEKTIIDWNSKTTSRYNIEDLNEIVNAGMDIRRIKQQMKISSETSIFDGILLNIDINTLSENESYRFTVDNIKKLVDEFLMVEKSIFEQTNDKLIN